MRDQDATNSANKIFKLSPIQASVIYQISLICWIQRIPVPFRENSNTAMEQLNSFSNCQDAI